MRPIFTALLVMGITMTLRADDEAIARDIRWLDFNLQQQQRREWRAYQDAIYWQQIERQQWENQKRLDRFRDELLEWD